ncbi:Hypothetical predicted protein [Mytilus galloprovincialis]|uniref:Uncharacterized protein n=1 Tax=Mytilus galloprovincialis TaxID=29158 RepID=A0A8B6EYX8_MYTGA|nr:Hypothetical predicted protein [Mytilus galloprovincialis]
MVTRTTECTEEGLEMAELKFKRSCEHIVLLNQKLDDLQVRYDKAKAEDRRSFRYPLRLKIAVVDGVRNMYYEYAMREAEKIATIKGKLLGYQAVIEVDESSDESEDERSEVTV